MPDSTDSSLAAAGERSGDNDADPSSRNSALAVSGSAATAPRTEEPWRQGWLARLFPPRRNRTRFRADLADALSAETTEGRDFTPEEKTMLNNILHLQDVRVEDLMVPRADIRAVEFDTPLGEVLRIFEDSGHSRLPVYVETLDDPRGMILIRDVMGHITKTSALTDEEVANRAKPGTGNLDLGKVALDKPLRELDLVRKVLFVPPSMLAADLMARMQAARTQMALVIDEFGGTEGLVSLEDIVELIVGDIGDEHDEDEQPLIEDRGDGVFIVDAKAELDEVAQALGNGFDVGEYGQDVDTIGGLVFALTGRVPARGEVFEGLGYEFRVIDADPRRIKRIELAPAKRRRQPRRPI